MFYNDNMAGVDKLSKVSELPNSDIPLKNVKKSLNI